MMDDLNFEYLNKSYSPTVRYFCNALYEVLSTHIDMDTTEVLKAKHLEDTILSFIDNYIHRNKNF